eukprot:m.177969 g.177969  ORF g.177969 m.177969 type:complete len:75 (-) comp14452_c0_seq1:39-263(-)
MHALWTAARLSRRVCTHSRGSSPSLLDQHMLWVWAVCCTTRRGVGGGHCGAHLAVRSDKHATCRLVTAPYPCLI